jgi:hypothetical protein
MDQARYGNYEIKRQGNNLERTFRWESTHKGGEPDLPVKVIKAYFLE